MFISEQQIHHHLFHPGKQERPSIPEYCFTTLRITGKLLHMTTMVTHTEGPVWTFTTMQPPWQCGDPLLDTRDGQTYNTVQIGTQCWMAENLNIGTMIPGANNMANNSIIEKYCYDNNTANCNTYGGLYQWNEMMQYTTTPGVQGICPAGWHLPTDTEWTTLTDYVNNQPSYQCNSTSGWIAKALAAAILWNSSSGTCAPGNNLSLNNATGFSTLPGGLRSLDGTFNFLSFRAFYWTSTEKEYEPDYMWYYGMYYNGAFVFRDYGNETYGRSVHCVKD